MVGRSKLSEKTPLLGSRTSLDKSDQNDFSYNEPFDKEVNGDPDWWRRGDVRMWAGGIFFIAALIGAIFGVGAARGWDASSGYAYNTSQSTRGRFLPEPFDPEPGVKGRYGPSATGRWYFWKLPPDEVTWYTRLFVWICYCGHQIFLWVVQYHFQIEKAESGRKYSTSVAKWNFWYFGINVSFHLLHLLQTHVTYDATAQDVTIVSSQCSVIMMLSFITLMEYRDRGLFFGWPTRAHKDKISVRLRLNHAPIYVIRRYHGYMCAWGTVYTLWYHPMENTWGHALGFFHTWIVLLQGSLMYTKFHRNPYWKLLQEVWVGLHAGVVASQTGGPELNGTRVWPMFVFGFLTLFSLTHIFGLPFWRNIHFLFRLIPLTIVVSTAVYLYSQFPVAEGTMRWARLRELVQIPATYYGDILLAWGLLYIFLTCDRKLRHSTTTATVSAATSEPPRSLIETGVYLVLAFSMYAIFVVLSILGQYYDIRLALLAMTIISLAILTVLTCVSFMFTKLVVPSFLPKISSK